MAERAYCVPVDGAHIVLPNGSVVPAEGMDLELTTYVLRRIADGGLIIQPKVKASKKSVLTESEV
jgi:hypothetical protein